MGKESLNWKGLSRSAENAARRPLICASVSGICHAETQRSKIRMCRTKYSRASELNSVSGEQIAIRWTITHVKMAYMVKLMPRCMHRRPVRSYWARMPSCIRHMYLADL